jgi:hypothetical protein
MTCKKRNAEITMALSVSRDDGDRPCLRRGICGFNRE